ncbi:hypothetical protein, partial [Nitrosomonas halophila]|uniref:hypothetical protein n=1 Tax=Nitrosomonas halophila TaxID=44576 RepID=UPI001C40B8C7
HLPGHEPACTGAGFYSPEEIYCQNGNMGDKKLHVRKNSVCLFLSIDLKAEFLPGCAEVGAGFLSKL